MPWELTELEQQQAGSLRNPGVCFWFGCPWPSTEVVPLPQLPERAFCADHAAQCRALEDAARALVWPPVRGWEVMARKRGSDSRMSEAARKAMIAKKYEQRPLPLPKDGRFQ